MSRPTWDSYFMSNAELAKTMSTCIRRQVGAVIVKDKRIVATGFNGAPIWCRHCEEIGCLRESMNVPSGERLDLCRAVHAEENAILQAALHGVSVEGGTLYSTLQPCVFCAKSAINVGIKKIVFRGDYPHGLALELLKEAGIIMVKVGDELSNVCTCKKD